MIKVPYVYSWSKKAWLVDRPKWKRVYDRQRKWCATVGDRWALEDVATKTKTLMRLENLGIPPCEGIDKLHTIPESYDAPIRKPTKDFPYILVDTYESNKLITPVNRPSILDRLFNWLWK